MNEGREQHVVLSRTFDSTGISKPISTVQCPFHYRVDSIRVRLEQGQQEPTPASTSHTLYSLWACVITSISYSHPWSQGSLLLHRTMKLGSHMILQVP